jgi:transposase
MPRDATLYRQRHRFDIMFGRLKDWRRISMRCDRCAHAPFSAITLAASVISWLGQ